MTRIRFEDLPSTNTPRNAENLNKLNNVVIGPTEPTTGEEVWIDNINKKIYIKNDNDIYEEFYNRENREVYSTSEQRIGTWIDGKPLYSKTIEFTTTTSPESYRHNIPNINKVVEWDGHVTRTTSTSLNASFPLNQYNPVYPDHYNSLDSINTEKVEVFAGDNVKNGLTWTITMRYTKTTD